MNNKNLQRRLETLMPGGIPKNIRVWDNGGGAQWFCRRCLRFSDESWEHCECGRKMLPAGEGSFDRYTVVYCGNVPGANGRTWYRGMSRSPCHPQGFGQWGESERRFDAHSSGFVPAVGNKSPWGDGDSRRITFAQLPEECQTVVLDDYKAIWKLT